jgi:DNA polymerase III subunit delta'
MNDGDGRTSRWPIIGHSQAVREVGSAVEAGTPSHAYLITGPAGIGRTTFARTLAQALNCERPASERPCGQCPTCKRIQSDSHPDVALIDLDWQAEMIGAPRGDASRARQRLSIDTVRWLRQDIVTRPIMGRWKVQIIDDADLFSESAPDAFLKTLEEPPPYAVIVLIASSPENVSETVRSRCRHIPLGTLSAATIREALEGQGVPATEAALLARSAHGRVAWAFRMADDPEAVRKRREKLEAAYEHISTPLGKVEVSGIIASNHSRNRDNTFELLDLYAGLWRDALLYRTGLDDITVFPEVSDRMEVFADRFEVSQLARAVWATQRCMEDLGSNMQARIALHAMVMQWP